MVPTHALARYWQMFIDEFVHNIMVNDIPCVLHISWYNVEMLSEATNNFFQVSCAQRPGKRSIA